MKSLSSTRVRDFLIWSLLLTIGWLILWFAPWQAWLVNFIWLRVGLALIIFIVPGFCIYGLLRQDPSWLNYLAFGFVISHLLMALLGMLGRFLHLSFDFLQHAFMFISLILLLFFAVPKIGPARLHFRFSAIRNLISYWALISITFLAILLSIQRVITDDDLIYLGYLTNWQNSAALNFNDVFHGVDALASSRHWIASTPFGQAFLAATSHLPGIFILGGFYEPFLVVLSIASTYELARTIGLSRAKAIASVVFQIVFLALLSEYLHPGARFFIGLSVDKAMATFIVIPVFLQSIVRCFQLPAKENVILLFLIGLSLMMMHPVALAFAIMVAGLMLLFGLNRGNVRARAFVLFILVLIMLPQIAIRFINSEAQIILPYSAEDARNSPEMVSIWRDTQFYGFNPSILAMHIPYAEKFLVNVPLLQFVWLAFPIVGAFVAIKHIRKDHLSQYVLACFLLGALAGIPFTGWILGSIFSAWMLERALWLYPFGISMVFTMTAISNIVRLTPRLKTWARAIHDRSKSDRSTWLVAILTVFSAIILVLFMREKGLPNLARLESSAARYRVFSQIGQFMDSRTSEQTFAVGTERLNDYIPGISSKVKVIYFRPSDSSIPAYFYSPQERAERLAARESIFSQEVPVEDRIQLIRKYHIQFLWLREGEYHLVKRMVSAFPDLFTEHLIGGYYLIEVH